MLHMDAERIQTRIKLFFDSYGIEGVHKGYLEMVLLRLEGLYINEKKDR